MIIGDFLKALGQLPDPRFRRVLFMGIGLTFLLLFAVYAIVVYGVALFAPDVVTLPVIGEVTWVKSVIGWGSMLLMFGLSVFLMIPVASAFTSMFLDQVADAVEDQHYPSLPPVQPVPISEAFRDTLSFMGVLIVANLAALVLYLFFAPFAPLIFWALNGFLLGREYFQLVAIRRMDRRAAQAMWRDNLGTVWLTGGLMAIPLTVPVLNLIVPILGAATFTHLFHRLNRSA